MPRFTFVFFLSLFSVSFLCNGNLFSADRSPERIVSLAPGITEILYRLDLGDRIAGVTEFSNFPPETRNKPKVGGFANPNVERIIALRPDLVIAIPNVGNRAPVETVERLGVPILIVETRSLEELYQAIDRIGTATGRPDQAGALVKEIQEEISLLVRAVRQKSRPRVLLTFSRDPFIIAGSSSFPGELIRLAGGQVPLFGGKTRYPRIGIEAVLEYAPEVILEPETADMSSGVKKIDLLGSWERWSSIPAVREKQVFGIESDLIFRPGPRTPAALRQLIQILHPEVPAVKENGDRYPD
ncbi:MAG: cobalamin-binding protein [Acidobacteria bacterium]|nr:cobalamin-binding protein [Acidobacteriota bacterium]